MMKSCGVTFEAYRTVRKVFCQHLPDITKLTLLKVREMDMQLRLWRMMVQFEEVLTGM